MILFRVFTQNKTCVTIIFMAHLLDEGMKEVVLINIVRLRRRDRKLGALSCRPCSEKNGRVG